MSSTTTAAVPSMPLTIGSAKQFRTLRDSLMQLQFTEKGICRRLELDSIFEFRCIREERQTGIETRDALDVLIRLLMDGETVGTEQIGLLPAGLIDTLEALGLALKAPEGETRYYCPVVLYPVAGLYTASDRNFPPDGIHYPLPPDVVYPAITANTRRFLSILPNDPCEAFLDLCSGTGIAAMVAAAHHARRSWAADLAERCVHFSDFNRRLSGLENVTSAQGDLYDATGGLTFDRIVAHPPYVPSKDYEYLFRDGGEDGEQILGRIVAGLPRYLRPGGRFYCQTLATDREGETVEQRLRRWLGDAESEFDVFGIATEYRRKPEKVIEAVIKAKGRLGKLGEKAQLYEKLRVTGVFYGTLVIERRQGGGAAAVTARAVKSPQATGDAVEWLRRWEQAAASPEFLPQILECRPRLAAHCTLHVVHTVQDGQFVPTQFEARSSYPLTAVAPLEPWVAVLMGACDGTRTARELFVSFREQDVISAVITEIDFAAILKQLFSNTFLEHERYPLPVPFVATRDAK
jgi:methylase of polypeptide subunit release factors